MVTPDSLATTCLDDPATSGAFRREELAARLAAVLRRVDEACRRAGRAPGDVAIMPVTKFHPVGDIRHLQALGVELVGESRDKDAAAKAEAVAGMRWAMIGRVQSKKANSIARWADEVHSVDSLKLAEALQRGRRRAIDQGHAAGPLGIYVQLSADGDASRGGATASDVTAIVRHCVTECPDLQVRGIMAMAPLHADPATFFRTADQLRRDLAVTWGRELGLSAGMSGDMEHAIAAGSTVVRIGTGILGPRPSDRSATAPQHTHRAEPDTRTTHPGTPGEHTTFPRKDL